MTTWIHGRPGRVLNLLGIVIVGYSVLVPFDDMPVFALVLSLVALVAWAATLVLPQRWLLAPFIVMVVAGAIATVPTNGVLAVPVLVAAIRCLGVTTFPVWQGIALAALGVVLLPVGLFVAPMTALGVAGAELGLVVAALGGFSRRQARIADVRERELLRQHARGAALAERQAVARDIHDVLAHSLGGLVLQLDAIDAQLEAGKVPDATVRVHQARALAAEGLAEARRAVDALRDDRSAPVAATELVAAIDELVDAHRALGGTIDFESSGTARGLDGIAADALRRALQEALTNARKHAPGAPVTARLRWGDGVDLEVVNDVTASGRGAGPGTVSDTVSDTGHGLAGMAERFDGVGSATAAAIGGRFIVHVRVDE